ncbi:MAG: LysE family transporter [bacterium]|nr:LysE family transporter [bacterium]
MPAFLLQAVLISLSGVMAPGPLSASVVSRGHRCPHAGALAALGHALIELPLMAAVLFGFAAWADRPLVRALVGLTGGMVLLWMGLGLLGAVRRPSALSRARSAEGSALRAGMVLTGANPYLLVWWASVGAALLLRASQYGPAGIALFALLHWLCDLLWLWLLSAIVHGGGNYLGSRFQLAVLAVSGLFLLWMGVDFVRDGAALLRRPD